MQSISMSRLLRTAAVSSFVLILTSCATNRVSLSPYIPHSRPSGMTYTQAPMVVARFEDQRFRLYSYTASDMGDTVGWGQGTGTIYTPQNIPEHVTKALVIQYQTYGMNVSYDPSIRCRIKGTRDHPRIVLSGRSSRRGTILCGGILDYQFQLDHPRLMLGFISSLDMNAGAFLYAQASLHLYLVSGGSGRILWSGIATSAQEKDGIRPPSIKEQAVSFLEDTLSKAIAKSAIDLSKAEQF